VRPIFKYTLQTLFFVILCVAGFLAAYRAGLDRGYTAGHEKWRRDQYLPRAYFVADLAGGSYLIQDIENAITQIDPTVAGGPAHLQLLIDRNRNPVFIISADSSLHDRVAAVLEELRTGNQKSASQ
jgi:hypothetical protein